MSTKPNAIEQEIIIGTMVLSTVRPSIGSTSRASYAESRVIGCVDTSRVVDCICLRTKKLFFPEANGVIQVVHIADPFELYR